MVDMAPEVGTAIGPYYVYALIDPRDDSIFYIGKGTGRRLMDHGRDAHLTADRQRHSPKIERIKEIRNQGLPKGALSIEGNILTAWLTCLRRWVRPLGRITCMR